MRETFQAARDAGLRNVGLGNAGVFARTMGEYVML
jgi:hypothetical protein